MTLDLTLLLVFFLVCRSSRVCCCCFCWDLLLVENHFHDDDVRVCVAIFVLIFSSSCGQKLTAELTRARARAHVLVRLDDRQAALAVKSWRQI